jgi:hypothetical protein
MITIFWLGEPAPPVITGRNYLFWYGRRVIPPGTGGYPLGLLLTITDVEGTPSTETTGEPIGILLVITKES